MHFYTQKFVSLRNNPYLCTIKSFIMGNMSVEETESHAMRVKKLADSQPVISSGMETPISIQKLLKSIDEIKRPFAFKESSNNGEQASDVLSECKDKRLISILQIK